MHLANKKRVAILLDVAGLSGSARVALQHSSYPLQNFEFLLILFSRDKSKLTELIKTADSLNISYQIIEEKGVLDFSVIINLFKILKNNFCIIESNHYKTHIIALILSGILGIKWVAVSHGWTSENIKVRIYNSVDYLTLPFASLNIAVSNTLAKKIRSLPFCRHKVINLPTALDSRIYQNISRNYSPENASATLRLVAIGRLSFEKGFDCLIKAADILKNCKIDFQLTIIGHGPEFNNLHNLVKEYSLESEVRLVGHKESKETQLMLATSDCLIIPSRSEGLPNTLLEAMYFKVPVISTLVGEIPAALKGYDRNLLSDPGDARKLADSVIYFSSLSSQETKNLSQFLASRLNKKYTAEKRSRNIRRIYNKLLNIL